MPCEAMLRPRLRYGANHLDQLVVARPWIPLCSIHLQEAAPGNTRPVSERGNERERHRHPGRPRRGGRGGRLTQGPPSGALRAAALSPCPVPTMTVPARLVRGTAPCVAAKQSRQTKPECPQATKCTVLPGYRTSDPGKSISTADFADWRRFSRSCRWHPPHPAGDHISAIKSLFCIRLICVYLCHLRFPG